MTPKLLPKNYQVYFAVFTAHIGVFIAGTAMSWTSPVLAKLTTLDDNPLGRIITSSEQGLLGSIGAIGNFVGAFLSGFLAKKYGRKFTLMLMGFPILITYLIIAFSHTIWLFYLAMSIGGITTAGVFTVNPMYFGEIAETSNRGFLGAAMNCFVNFGLLFSVSVGPFISFFWFHIILATFPVLYIVLLQIFSPESPYYLVSKDLNEAEISLRRLRGTEDVRNELNQIKESTENSTNGVYINDILNSKGLRKGLVIGSGLVFFQQFSGTSIIMTYGQIIFEQAGDFVSAEVSPIIIIGIQFLFGFIAPVLTDRSGRRILLMISHVGMTVSLFAFGVYFFLKNNKYSVEFIVWLPLISLVLFTLFYSIGSGPLPWTVIGEIFPLDAKSLATSICSSVCWVSAFVIILSFNWVTDYIGIGPTFWIFASFGVVASFFVSCLVIETKKKSLQEIQDELNS